MAVNFAIVGFGRMAESCHKEIIESIRGAKLLAVCDTTPARREAAEAAGVERVYSTLSQLLKDEDVDAVTICTPSHNHMQIARQVAKAGKHIVSEKPVARTVEELKKMIAAAKRAGVYFTVFHNRRFDQDFLAAKKIVQKGMVGDVVSIEAHWHVYGGGVGFGTPEYNQRWRVMKKYGGGVLMDLGVHMLDQMNQITDARPKYVYAFNRGGVWAKDCDDFSTGIVRFDNDMIARVEASGLSKVKLPRWRITGTKGMAVGNAENKSFDLYIGDTNTPTKQLSYDKPRQWDKVYSSLVSAITRKNCEPAVSPESVVTTMRLIEAYQESSKTGKSVQLRGKLPK